MTNIQELETRLLTQIEQAATLASLDKIRVAALGKKGEVSALMKGLGAMPPEERKAFGQSVNGVKTRLLDRLEAQKIALETAELNARLLNETADITLPVMPSAAQKGRIHPISQVWDELTEIFADMGFSIAEGPDIEDDFHNFTALVKLNFE